MALWRDPLDELIAEVERIVPSVSTPPEIDYQKAFVGMQFWLDAHLSGRPEDVARVEQDPYVKMWLAEMDHLRQQRAAEEKSRPKNT